MEIAQLIISSLTVIGITVVLFIKNKEVESLKTINTQLKDYISIFKIDEVKKHIELREDNARLALTNWAQRMADDFAKDSHGVLEKMLGDKVDQAAGKITDQYDEICEAIYELLTRMPNEQKLEFIAKYLPLTKEDFLEELRAHNELPTS